MVALKLLVVGMKERGEEFGWVSRWTLQPNTVNRPPTVHIFEELQKEQFNGECLCRYSNEPHSSIEACLHMATCSVHHHLY